MAVEPSRLKAPSAEALLDDAAGRSAFSAQVSGRLVREPPGDATGTAEEVTRGGGPR